MTAAAIEFKTRARYRDVRAAASLSSVFVVLVLILAPLAAAASLAAYYLLDANPPFFLGLSAVCVGLAGLSVLLFAFGTTYFPFRQPPRTVSQILEAGGNSADAADFHLVRLLGPFANRGQDESLPEALQALLMSSQGQRLLHRLELAPEIIGPLITTHVLPELSWSRLGEVALKVAASMQQPHLNIFHVLAVLLLHPSLRRDLRKLEYTEQDIAFVIWWQIAAQQERRHRAQWWRGEQLLDFTGIGLSWASGYTPFVDQFARLPQGNPWDIPLGHEAQVEELINTLARARQANVLVVGQPGSGRTGVVKEVARRVNANRAHPALNGQRVMYIHIGQLLGIAGSGPEQMAIVSRALTEMERAGNVIAILDGLSTVFGGGGSSAVNLTDVIMPFFSSGTVRVVVIMSADDYHLRFKGNAELLKLFEVVQVEPLSLEQTLQLLALSAEEWEKRTGIYLPYKTLRAIVRNTSTIMPEIPFPEKAFDVLEDALAISQKGRGEVLTAEQVTDIISRKIGFNVGKLAADEKSHLLNLEEFIHKRVVNQENGVAAVARAMIRARAGVSGTKRPIGTFLFLGPTGVGKTETSKALAEAYFGSEEYLQRLDMSEYQGPEAIGRLIGTPRQPAGTLTSIISDHPFTVLLLD
ncbi:MAG: AAA family ATPase [Patescibacteria group bacterium]